MAATARIELAGVQVVCTQPKPTIFLASVDIVCTDPKPTVYLGGVHVIWNEYVEPGGAGPKLWLGVHF